MTDRRDNPLPPPLPPRHSGLTELAEQEPPAGSGLELDRVAHEVRIGGEPVAFTHIEFTLLAFLLANPGRAFTREELLSAVWGAGYNGGTRTVDVHVRRVRAKLGSHALRLRTLHRVGYRWDAS